MTVTIRELQTDHDAPDVIPILQQLYPEMDNRRYRHFMAQDYPMSHFMVAEAGDTILGVSSLYRDNTDPRHRANIMIAVHPDYHRKGIGMMLFDDLEAAARAHVMQELRCEVSDDTDAAPYQFVQRLGFRVHKHMHRSTLDLKHLTNTQVDTAVQQAEDQGIEFTTLSDKGDTPENRQQVYRINKIASQDLPNQGPFMRYEAYEKAMMSSSTHPPQGIFIAIDEERWVGMSQVSLHIEDGYALNEMTSVLPTHDDRTVLKALKLLAARFARDHSFELLRDYNDADNQLMLEVNDEIGYDDEPGFFVMSKGIR
jgi:GNAT superfamily N-acetyltransferase